MFLCLLKYVFKVRLHHVTFTNYSSVHLAHLRTQSCSTLLTFTVPRRTSHAQRTTLCSTRSSNTWWRNWESRRDDPRRRRSGWRRYMQCWPSCHGALVGAAGSWRRCVKLCGRLETDPWRRRGSWARCYARGVTLWCRRTAPPLWGSRGITCWGVHLTHKVAFSGFSDEAGQCSVLIIFF